MAIRTVRRRIIPSPERKPRGRPFQSRNPGRPLGSKNKVTQTLEQLAEGQAEQVFQKVTEQALAGDVSRQKIFLDRVYPPAKDRPINCDIRVIAPFSTSVGEHQAQTERAGKTRER